MSLMLDEKKLAKIRELGGWKEEDCCGSRGCACLARTFACTSCGKLCTRNLSRTYLLRHFLLEKVFPCYRVLVRWRFRCERS